MLLDAFWLICVLVLFYKIGDLDREIGNPLGVATGVCVAAANLLFVRGTLGLLLLAVGGYVFLTIYKIADEVLRKRSPGKRHTRRRDPADDEGRADDP